jgi:hypothetical protein
MAGTIGRPTDYDESVQAMADAYVDGGFMGCGDIVPSRAGLSIHLGRCRQTLVNWEKHPEFLATLDRLSSLQERISLNGGLKGDLNSTIVKLLLANHGYSDKQAIDHSSPDGSMTPTKIILTAAKHDRSDD